MQRSSYDEKDILKALLLFGLLLFYEPLTTIYLWLPPFLGVAAWAIYSQEFIVKVGWLFYLYLYQNDHFIPFFLLFVALFFTLKLLDLTARILACSNCLRYFAVLYFYSVMIGLFWGVGTLLMEQEIFSWYLVLFYMVSDLIMVRAYED